MMFFNEKLTILNQITMSDRKQKGLSFGVLCLLLFSFVVYSSCSIFAKLASSQPFQSKWFFLFYGLELVIIAVYAFLWQIVLKKIDLSIAFMCKSITIVFSLLIAHFIFNENISISNSIGSLFIISGIIVGSKV